VGANDEHIQTIEGTIADRIYLLYEVAGVKVPGTLPKTAISYLEKLGRIMCATNIGTSTNNDRLTPVQ
jgi:hypothetical protein